MSLLRRRCQPSVGIRGKACERNAPADCGADGRIRTADRRITNALLYRLSYIGLRRGVAKYKESERGAQYNRPGDLPAGYWCAGTGSASGQANLLRMTVYRETAAEHTGRR